MGGTPGMSIRELSPATLGNDSLSGAKTPTGGENLADYLGPEVAARLEERFQKLEEQQKNLDAQYNEFSLRNRGFSYETKAKRSKFLNHYRDCHLQQPCSQGHAAEDQPNVILDHFMYKDGDRLDTATFVHCYGASVDAIKEMLHIEEVANVLNRHASRRMNRTHDGAYNENAFKFIELIKVNDANDISKLLKEGGEQNSLYKVLIH